MKRLNQNNLDIYIFIRDFMKENGYSPSYREIQENTNYKSIAGTKAAIEKLADLKLIKIKRNENGIGLARTIKIIDDKNTRELIEELREKER